MSNTNVCMNKNYFYIILLLFICICLFQIYYFINNNKLIINNEQIIEKPIIKKYKLSQKINLAPIKKYLENINTHIYNNNLVPIKKYVENNYIYNNNNVAPIKKYVENINNDNYNNIAPIKKYVENRDKNVYNDNYNNIAPIKKYVENINNDNLLPIKKYLENRDRSLFNDKLVAPEKRVPFEQYPNTIKNMINIPTRGYPDNYQLLGLLYRENDEKIVQLFGRPTFPGSNQYEYYATTEQYGFANKIPIITKGQKEIEDNTEIDVPILKGKFKVKLYNNNTPRYNPYI